MRYIFNFPDIGEGVSEGVILKWYIEKGQTIKSGDNVVQMETDKVVADIPSPKAGTVVSRFGKPGDALEVGDALVELEIEGIKGKQAQEISKEKPQKKKETKVKEESFGIVGVLEEAGDSAYLPASGEGLEKKTEEKPRKKALATPVARAVAKNMGVDVNQVPGTGPRGRVTKQDILDYVHKAEKPSVGRKEEKPAEPDVEYVPLTQTRKTIAHRMSLSKKNAAHMAVFEEAEVSELVRVRNSQKERLKEEGVKLTYLAFIVKAAAMALREHKILNSRLDMENDRIVMNNHINISIAVDAPEGLVAPVIFDADSTPIVEIAKKIVDLADKADNRKLKLEEMQNGTFSVTNFGSIGGLYGMPVINYPQAAILGVGRLHEKPVIKDGQVAPGWVMPLSLAVDHRIVDGGETTRFINRVIGFLEDPVSMMLL